MGITWGFHMGITWGFHMGITRGSHGDSTWGSASTVEAQRQQQEVYRGREGGRGAAFMIFVKLAQHI